MASVLKVPKIRRPKLLKIAGSNHPTVVYEAPSPRNPREYLQERATLVWNVFWFRLVVVVGVGGVDRTH